jgi:hypothetical protein
MAPARRATWMDKPVPRTPHQRSAYIDACTAWLVAVQMDAGRDDARLLTRTRPAVTPTADVGVDGVVSRLNVDRHIDRGWMCILCGAPHREGGKVVLANPFAQQSVVHMCDAC